MSNLNDTTSGVFVILTTTSLTLFSVRVEQPDVTRTVNIRFDRPGIISLGRNLMVTNSSFSNRQKGVQVSSEQESFSVLVANIYRQGRSYGEYLAYPCHDFGLDNYTYIAVSTESQVSTAYSQVLLVGCQDNTTITITPTHPVVLPQDAQINGSNITVEAGASHTIVLHEGQTLLFRNLENDLSGTRIVSDKHLTVVSGHQCGNIPKGEQFCEHLTVQIPPTATWGTKFLLAPFAGRENSQLYQVTKVDNYTIIQQTCNTTTTPLRGQSGLFLTHPYPYCSLSSNKPILVTQWGLGGQRDGIGDPVVTTVPPVAQYINKVSFFVYPIHLTPSNYITVTVPAEHFGEDRVLLDGTPITCSWTLIYNARNGTVGYGCNQLVSSGTHIMSHANTTGRLSVMVHGYPQSQPWAYAYNAGMKLGILKTRGT